jgi:hypothetical protein
MAGKVDGGGLRWLLLWLDQRRSDLEMEVGQLCDSFSPLFVRSSRTTCEALWPVARMLWHAKVPRFSVSSARTLVGLLS